MSASWKVPSISARSASVQLPALPSLRWVHVIWFARFFSRKTLILKHTERCNQKRTRSKSSFCCFFSFMSQLNLFGRCFVPSCLFRFPSHAPCITYNDLLHNSFLFNPSSVVFRCGGLLLSLKERHKSRDSKFNSSQASHSNALSKVKMECACETFVRRTCTSWCGGLARVA